MTFEVAMTGTVNDRAMAHLLQHYKKGRNQEDLSFALWRPSTGESRRTGIIYEIVLPESDERILHGNVSFEPGYLIRAINLARKEKAGLAFMHSHPSSGWQGLSQDDIVAEREVLAYPAGATDLPLIGLTMGVDGYWSARFWMKHRDQMTEYKCGKVRVIGMDSFQVFFDDWIMQPPERKEVLKRTFDTLGNEAQQAISRLRVGVVGLGSVGSIVAECLARMGISYITLIDYDHVKEHNLDRLLNATKEDIGELKVHLAERKLRRHATSENFAVVSLAKSIRESTAYLAAIDCDILFSCVDKPLARDILNYIANAHLIPVIDGGIHIENTNDRLQAAHWRSHIIVPHQQCMRCLGQYSTSMVLLENEGLLDDPSYVSKIPSEARRNNQNVFPFSLSAASMEVNLMLHYLLRQSWWPNLRQQDYQFVLGENFLSFDVCHEGCEFRKRVALGDMAKPPFLLDEHGRQKHSTYFIWQSFLRKVQEILGFGLR